jgi:hypothetical protein
VKHRLIGRGESAKIEGMLRAVRLGTLLVGAAGMAACGVTLIGGTDSETNNAPPSSVVDGSSPPTNPLDDAGNPIIVSNDGSVTTNDGGVDGGGGSLCPSPSTTFTNGRLTVPPAASAITIDGDLKEWQCAKFYSFDKNNAAVHEGTDKNISNAYAFAVSWDTAYIYVAVRVTDPTAKEGNTTPNVFNNDGVELYLGGDAVWSGTYTSKDHQWVVDWSNRAREYQNDNGEAPSGGFKSAVTTTTSPTGFHIEMRVAASELGRTSFPLNDKLGLAFVGLDSDGTNRSSWMLWYRPAIACGGGCCQIWCNTNFFGELVLGP